MHELSNFSDSGIESVQKQSSTAASQIRVAMRLLCSNAQAHNRLASGNMARAVAHRLTCRHLMSWSFEQCRALQNPGHSLCAGEDIEVFSASYRGSKEEEKDLVTLYTKFKGDFKKVDSHRYMDIIDAAMSSGQLKEYKTYRKGASEVSKTPPHSNPLAPSKKKKNGGSTSELTALINHRRKKQMDSLASAWQRSMATRERCERREIQQTHGRALGRRFLAAQKRVMKSSKSTEEPSEEEFLAAQKRVKKKIKG